jgi:hypothetical protein
MAGRKSPQVRPAPKANPPGVQNLPPGYVSYTYFAFNPKTGHRIYSNDNATWVDESGNPVPAAAK